MAIVLVVLVLLFLFVIPVPTSFTRTVSTITLFSVFSNDPSAYAGVINVTINGSAVSGSFTTSLGQPVAFSVVDSAGVAVFSITAGSGTFSFAAGPGPYAFVAVSLIPDTVSVSGTVDQPLIFGLFYSD